MKWLREWLSKSKTRATIYVAAGALAALLGVYGVLTKEEQESWLDLIGQILAVIGSATALGHLTPDHEQEPGK